MPTIVYVVGASGSTGGGGGLALRGYREVSVPLPGRDGQFDRSYQAPQDLKAFAAKPSPMAGVTLDDYTEVAVDVVRRVAEYGPVVLFGGSMGGATMSRVGNAVPDLIDRMVYASAFLCVEQPSVIDYLSLPEGQSEASKRQMQAILNDPAQVGNPEKLGATRINWRSANREFLAAVKASTAGDSTDAEFYAALNSLQPDESIEVPFANAQVKAETWGRVPRTFIRYTLDQTIPLALQDRMIAEADRLTPDNKTDVRTVETAHLPSPAKFAEVMDIVDELTKALV